jgi:hypothetical protein
MEHDSQRKGKYHMPKFIIERDMPGLGQHTPGDLKAASQKSCGVLNSMGPSIQWIHSYITDDRMYCIYLAPDEAAVRRHAAFGGFPADRVVAIRTVIDPATAE